MILRAAWVIPVTAPPIRDGFVDIAGDEIVGVGAFQEWLRASDATGAAREVVEDLGQAILIPGLVNPHTHLELTCYAGLLEPAGFWEWLRKLVALRAAPGQEEREGEAVVAGAWQSLRAGVTCVGDISRRNLAWRQLKAVPIRKVCFVELLTLADHPPRNPDELRAAVTEVEEDELLTVGISPHAPYTVPGDQIRAAIALADQLRRPWCSHWAETREEVEFVRGRPDALPSFLLNLLKQCDVRSPGLSPARLLERCCRGLRPGALAHGNYLDDDDIACLAAAGHVIMYCPRAHRFFDHEPHPLPRLLAAGVPVAVGTDSAASNEDLSPVGELRYVLEHVPQSPASDALLRMATLEAARALGLHEQIGSLEPGKQADLAAFPCETDEREPVASLIRRAAAPTGVWVAGRRVV